MDKLLQQLKSQVRGPQSFAGQYVRSCRESEVNKNITEALKRLNDPKYAQALVSDAGQAYKREIEQWAVDTRQALATGLATKAAAAAVRELQSSFRWVEHYGKRKQASQVEKYKQTCIDVLSKKATDFSGCTDKQAADVRAICAALGVDAPAMGPGAQKAATPVQAEPAAQPRTAKPPASVVAAPGPVAAAAPAPARGATAGKAPSGPKGDFDKATFDAVKKALDGNVRWMGSHSNGSRVQEYMAKVEATVAANLPVLEAEAVYLHSVREKIDAAKQKLTEAAVGASKSKIDQQRRWCTTHLGRGDQAKVLQARESLVKAMEEQRTVLLQTPAGETVLREAAGFLAELDVNFAQLKLTQEAVSYANKLKSQLKWVDNSLKRKDTAKASRFWEQAQAAALELLPGAAGPSPYSGLAAADAAIAEYEKMAVRVEQEVTAIVLEQELAGIERQMKSAATWVKSYMRNKDVRKAMQHIEDLKALAESAKTYSNSERAQQLHADGMRQVKEAIAEVGPIQAAQEIAALKRPAEQTLRWLQLALDSKNEDKCMLLQENLSASAKQLDRYSDHPDAKAFLAEVKTLLDRIDAELGDIIAEKAYKSLLFSGEAAYRWVEDSIRRKDTRRTQVYLEQLSKATTPLEDFAVKFPDAASFLQRSAALQERVDGELGDLLAEAEVSAGSRRIDVPLKWFIAALDGKKPAEVVTKRQRVVEAAIQLRSSRFCTRPAAAAKLAEVDAALARCEREMADMLAADAVRKVEGKARAQMSLAGAAAARGDTRSGLQQLQALHRCAQPLRAQFGDSAAAGALLKEIDACTRELEPKLVAAGEEKEAMDLLKSLESPLDSARGAAGRSDVSAAVSNLRKANDAAASLRARYGYRADVQRSLKDLDSMNLSLLGGIPDQREAAPCLEVDWRLPVAQQDALKAINAKFQVFEKLYSSANSAVEQDLDMDGERSPPGDRWLDRQIRDLEKAIDALGHIESQALPALQAVAPDHPGIGLAQSGVPELKSRATALLAAAKPLFCFAKALYDAKSGFSSPFARYQNHQARATQPGNSNEPRDWASGIDELKKAVAAFPALDAVSQLPDGYESSSADAFKAEAEASLIEAESRFKQACVKWHKASAADQDLYNMKEFRDLLRARFPDAEENSVIDELHSRVESVLAEEAAKREAERKAQHEAYEKARLAKLKAQTDAWQAPYSGGDVSLQAEGKTVATWQYDGASKTFTRTSSASKHTYRWTATTGAMKLLHHKGDASAGFMTWYGQDGGVRFDLRSSCNDAKYLWVSYIFNAGTSTFEPASKANPPWKLDSAQGTLTAQGTAADKFGCSSCSCANVPPPLALFAAVAGDFLDKNIPKWVADERKKPRRCNTWVGSGGSQAYLCSSCGFGSSADNCCVCGKWMASSKYQALLCTSCGFGSSADNCCKCGNWAASSKVVAHMCSDCGWGSRGDNCCKLK